VRSVINTDENEDEGECEEEWGARRGSSESELEPRAPSSDFGARVNKRQEQQREQEQEAEAEAE
jgi:hypothetical protein